MRRVAIWSFVAVLALAIAPAAGARAQATGVTRSVHAGWNLIALPPDTALTAIQGLYTLQPDDADYETVQP
jgi:hypothetical protein